MAYNLREAINSVVRNERLLLIEERLIGGKIYLIGYPKEDHFKAQVACFIWHEQDDGRLSCWKDYKEIPDFLNPKEFGLEEVEQALDIIEGL